MKAEIQARKRQNNHVHPSRGSGALTFRDVTCRDWVTCAVRPISRIAFAVTTDELRIATASELAWLSEHGYRFYKSSNQFRRKDSDGFSYVTIDVVTHNRADYHLSFYLGVRNDPIERTIKIILHDKVALTHFDRSLHHFTFNTGPSSHGWKQPLNGTWTLQNESSFPEVFPQVREYLLTVGLPFIDENLSSEKIRVTLLEVPGHVQNQYPWRQIISADTLYGDRQRLVEDFDKMNHRYIRLIPRLRNDFENFYRAALEH